MASYKMVYNSVSGVVTCVVGSVSTRGVYDWKRLRRTFVNVDYRPDSLTFSYNTSLSSSKRGTDKPGDLDRVWVRDPGFHQGMLCDTPNGTGKNDVGSHIPCSG